MPNLWERSGIYRSGRQTGSDIGSVTTRQGVGKWGTRERSGKTLEHDLASSYTIERELHGGGMSRVFLLWDLTLNRLIVLKILSSKSPRIASAERFRREIQLAAKLQHPYIVPLTLRPVISGTPFFDTLH